MATSYITRTSVATGDPQKGTWSAWVKRGNDTAGVVAEEFLVMELTVVIFVVLLLIVQEQ